MAKERIPVNLADPKDIRAKMPEIARLLAKSREELAAIKDQVALLSRIVGEVASPAATATASIPRQKRAPAKKAVRVRRRAPAQERAVHALEKAGRPMGPASLYRFMKSEGMETPSDINALNASLWAAANAGRIVKAPNGVYAALGAPTDRPLTDYDAAAANGMPVPDRLPDTNGSTPPKVPAS